MLGINWRRPSGFADCRQAIFRFLTVAALIWSSGEYRVLALSAAQARHSPLNGAERTRATTTMAMTAQSAAVRPRRLLIIIVWLLAPHGCASGTARSRQCRE